MRNLKVSTVALLSGLVLSACSSGSGVVGPEKTPEASSSAVDSPQPSESVLGAAPSSDPSTSGPGSSGGSSPASAASPSPSQPKSGGSAPLTVRVNRTCLRHGDELIMNAESVPGTDFAVSVGYTRQEGGAKTIPDYAYFDGDANPSGRITWTVVIRPDIAYGPAALKVVIKTPDREGAFNSTDLEIAKECP